MTRTRMALLLVCSLLLGTAATPALAEQYRFQPGDTLEISVWKEEALQAEAIVLPDGSISFPLVGSLQVAGLSAPELRTLLKTRLQAFMPEPVVTVIVTGTAGNRIYVIGKVVRPGTVELTAPTTVIQALALAGGLNRFADAEKIKILRDADGEAQFLRFNYEALMAGNRLEENILLQAGDVVLVP